MKKYLRLAGTAIALAFLAVPNIASAQFFNHLGAGVGVGTNGISVELTTPVFSPWVNLRGGVDIMPGITFNSDADFTYEDQNGQQNGTMPLEGDLGRTQGHVIFDINPIPGVRAFHVSVGAYFAGDKLLKITGYSKELADYSAATHQTGDVIIGDYLIPTDGKGNVDGGLKIKGFRPYIGIGWGNSLPGKLINFAIDLGVQFEGEPELYTKYGSISDSVLEDDNTFNKVRKALNVYPVLNLRLNFKAF